MSSCNETRHNVTIETTSNGRVAGLCLFVFFGCGKDVGEVRSGFKQMNLLQLSLVVAWGEAKEG